MNPEQAALQQFQQLKQDQNVLARQLADMDSTLKEHKLVLDTLSKVEPSRKCFRLINGVMVERTASEIIPAINKSIEQIQKLMKEVNDNIAAKTSEINKFMEHYKIQQRDQPIIAQA
ncbi:prefoldin subunit 2, putative [Entamoeba histolytica HM-1:IMSS-B]|uniref:Prefoldin subunit 2, putative n=6 Tax=Entamoeba histolytica TaxID=5759 RepID=C4M8V6_ENTH1|nr:prefoldin subunit 2, putative [Entamoeba histolytica HM-1:IMSS]EMD43274.1 prefoldin subunit 2, putative [Entamoeba histolytica KU27]EMH74320.1 prefoldin subunit 2, putative [Entamoeba histolytica HM-1:IMSS-B]EMS16709.1 prefoldin subunit 2, putative [Entamoeba histolytica HM-3:IMSS]ENY63303.1 prefoldin subunit 2, putative [Entamoeba histolytica HM-1:IMSS-A]GAT98057.1 prefoldin subunit 2 putative [Entamoeba histolytica]|eukprot:XP_649483.1 prefoldin subunit 2, putative [Entamoeba histolytica HM-1:IMSS]